MNEIMEGDRLAKRRSKISLKIRNVQKLKK